MARSHRASARHCSSTLSMTRARVSSWPARFWTTRCPAPATYRHSSSASTAPAARPTRSASKAAARPAPSARSPPSPTPSSTRWRPGASPASPVPPPRTASGKRCGADPSDLCVGYPCGKKEPFRSRPISANALDDAAPNDPERHRSCWQRRRWRAEQRIDDVAIIENRHIEPAQGGAAFAQFDLDAVLGQLDRPQQAQWWKSTRVEVVDLSRCLIARTELIDVHSDQRECSVVYSPISATENALHEPHVGICEGQPQGLTCLGIGLRHHPADVGQTDRAVEIGDRDWLGIDWINRVRAEHVERTAKKRRTTRDRHRRE